MLQQPLSIYRGYSNAGIGELPGDVAGKTRGEQYLAADPELWRDPALANAARRWMTLYDDQRVAEISYRLGQSIEAWSYFGYGDFRFVVRMVSGGEFASRLAYFAHGQVWRVQDFHNGNDPGAFLGQAEGFHPAWRQGQPIQPVVPMQPKMVWQQIIKTRSRAAIRLLAQLYRACVTGQPVVMGVPFREFVAGSSLHPLISFARAALPMEIKRDCRIRIFTGQPESYLSGVGANLVVVPEELAPSSLAARPDAALLDLNCELKAGPDADRAYAEIMVERVLKLPEMLIPCTGRLRFPASRLPNAAEVAKVAPIYNLVAASGNQSLMDDLFDHFQKEAKTRDVALDWKGIIEPEDWKQFSQSKLINLAFSQADSADLRALRKQSREELSARRLDLDGPGKAWIASLDQSSKSREILDLVQARLLSRDLSIALLRGISLHELSQLLDNPEMAGIVAEILCQSEISDEAAARLTERADHVRSMITVARDLPARRRAADIMVKSLACRKNLPAGLTEADLLALEPPEANTQLENYLNWAEVLELADSGHAPQRIARLGGDLQGRANRRKLFELLADSRFTALQRHFVAPQSWDNDIGDLLLDSTEQMGRVQDTDRLAVLAVTASSFPPKARLVLDERMERRPEETTRALVNTDAWLAWRRASRGRELARFSFRDCAANWILSGVTNPKVEEWKQVVLDLNYLSADDVRVLRSRFPGVQPPWPQISLFEEEQLWDVAGLCSDLAAVAELAEGVATGSPDYATVLGHSRFAGRISPQALRFLSQSPDKDAHLQEPHIELDEARYLAEKSGNRRARAVAVLIQAIIAVFPERAAQAEIAANEARLWNEPVFQKQVALWLTQRHHGTAPWEDLSLLEMLNGHFEKSSVPISQSDPSLEKLAWLYFDRGLSGLADLLQPDLYGRLVRSLLRGDTNRSLWKKLIDQINNSSQVAAEYHPLLLLTKKVTTLPTLHQSRIQVQGWSIFKTIYLLELPVSSCFLIQHGNILPALCLASSLRRDTSIGAVVSGILPLAGVNAFFSDPEWWEALLDSMERCRANVGLATPDRMEMAQSVLLEALQRLPELPETGIMRLEERMGKYCQQMP